jgi:antitoxin VapB
MNEKEQRLREFCRRRRVEGVWLRRRTNIAWLSDGADVHVDGSSSTGVGSLLWTPSRKVVYTTHIEAARLAEEEFGSDWEIRPNPWWEPAPRPEGRLATDFPDDPFADLRAPLTDLELRRIRAFGRFAGETLGAAMKKARPGMTEHELAAEVQLPFRRIGAQVPVLLVASDRRIARYRHPIPTSKRIERTVMVAVTPRRHGLMVALTRLVHFGRALPSELRRRHEAVCAVDRALHAATAPGQRWCDVLEVGRQVYRETGFAEEWTKHHQGGPVGYEGREFKATPSETRRIVERQAVGWNPSITGTKSEDTILSTGEVLTDSPGWPRCGGRPDVLLRRP